MNRASLSSSDEGGCHGGDDGNPTDEEEVSVEDSSTTNGTSETG